jgi:hypothetical protein
MSDENLYEGLPPRIKRKKKHSGILPRDRKRKRCGAKLRGGNRCRNWGMPNGRCRLHGGVLGLKGKKPGRKKGQKAALKTGEHETIWQDTLYDDELAWLEVMKLDVDTQLNEELKLITVRERRMLKRIEELNQKNFVTMEKTDEEESGFSKAGAIDMKRKGSKKENSIVQIQRIEEALTRVQERKAKLLDLKFKIQTTTDGDNGTLDQLVSVIEASRKAINTEKRRRERSRNDDD